MKMSLLNQYAPSLASLGVIAVITAFTIQVSIEQHQLDNRQQKAPVKEVAALIADSTISRH